MSIRPILVIPDPRLKQRAAPVEAVTEETRALIADMFETMYDAPGIGLAAPQIGVMKRIVVIDVAKREEEAARESAAAEAGAEAEADADADADAGPGAPAGEEDDDGPHEPIAMINPEIVWRSEQTKVYEEGCLSIPEYYEEVERPDRVRVRYLTPEGETVEREAGGVLAVCIQHEVDHLDGRLFIDYLSRLKRERVTKKFQKAARRAG